ncbi:MAG: hypothetical protein AAF468_22230 [Pseudomonadota bacterium]
MSGPSRFAVAKQELLTDLERVVADLFGGNAQMRHKRGSTWNVANPHRANSKPKQMVVWLSGAVRGGFKDFTNPDVVKGDVIDLVAFVLEGRIDDASRKAAIEWAEDRYGIREMDPAEKERRAQEHREKQEELKRQAEIDAAANRTRARKLFYSAEAQILDTPVDIYLQSRGIDLRAIKGLGHAIRYLPNAEYWMGAPHDADGKKMGKGPVFDAMLCAFINDNHQIAACHFTFLADGGAGKADVSRFGDDLSAKLMMCPTSGLFIPLTNGGSLLNLKEAVQVRSTDMWTLHEGVEDSLSTALLQPDLRCIAVGALAGLGTLPRHPNQGGFLVMKDNDWCKPQVELQFNKSIARLRSWGKPVEVANMPDQWGKDVNDAINRETEHDG